MKLCYFGDAQSIHVQKWCTYFSCIGNEVHLISFRKAEIPNVQVHYINIGLINVSGRNWKALLKFFKIRKLLKRINPDVFHAHYATSYGITAALVNFHPFVISVWGSDLLITPKKSIIIKKMLKWAFKRCDSVTVVADHMTSSLLSL